MNSQKNNTQYYSQNCVLTKELPNGIMAIYLGNPDESVVTFNETRLISFQHALAKAKDAKPKGLIIIGPKDDMFCAGADVKLIADVKDSETGTRLARQGQKVFDDLASLPFPTIATISGPCVGGGLELALACKYRIASNSRSTLIGLPETKLGILPGFGGTQRLPRLIGIRKALDIILAGKSLRAKQALRAGIVTMLVDYSELLNTAIGIIEKKITVKPHKLSLLDQFLTFTSLGRSFVAKSAENAVLKQTKGFYPAPPRALASVLYGLSHGQSDGLNNEADELGKLIITPESKALTKLFFLTEAAKRIGKSAEAYVKDWRAVVVGSGIMGSGIAMTFAEKRMPVQLFDSNQESLKNGYKFIKESVKKLKYLNDADRETLLNRIDTKSIEIHRSTNIIVEAVVEDLTVKKDVFKRYSNNLNENTILATNTSSLPITKIATDIKNPERVVGMHFFNPVAKMPLVEIIRGKHTSDETIVMTAALCNKIGKFPIIVEDVPGFLINRILTPYLNTAVTLLEDGYSMVDIDKCATKFGFPMGPIRLLDEVGLDVATHVLKVMQDGYGERMSVPDFAGMMVKEGRKGKKNGKGFYTYSSDGSAKPYNKIRELLNLNKPLQATIDTQVITDALIYSLINEAIRCLDEGVAGTPSIEAAEQIDLGSVMGIGFPPFRGGILHYAETIGFKKIVENMNRLKLRFGKRFEPWEGIVRRA